MPARKKTKGQQPVKKARRSVKDKNHELVNEARRRVVEIIDQIPPEDLISSIKKAPSLRGMILGYIAEEMFQKHILESNDKISEIIKHDDHDRSKNKSDRDFVYSGRKYSVQVKSIQTNSIVYNNKTQVLEATVQNDGSDRRDVLLPSGKIVVTTCYKRGGYDILAVPLFPFTGAWDFAYKWNVQCRTSTFKGYSEEDRLQLLASTERIYWPLDDSWSMNLIEFIDRGEPQFESKAIELEAPEIEEVDLFEE